MEEDWEMQDTIDLKQIFFVLKKRWKWILAGILVGALVFYAVSAFLLPKKYASSVELYVYNSNVTQGNNVNINDINASQKLVNTYIVVLENTEVLSEVASRLSTPVTVGELKAAVSMKAVNETEVLNISALTEDAALSAEICNTFAEVAPDVLKRVVKAGSVEAIGSARAATAPSSPNVKRNAVLGGLIGLVLAVGAALLVFLLDNTVKGEEDVRRRLDIPVLGEIPSFAATRKEERRRAH